MMKLKTRAGTPYYVSPEVIMGNYDYTCDLWSLGCILFCMLCGYPPFFADDDKDIMKLVMC
jgi:calcium-dependent protein kinase